MYKKISLNILVKQFYKIFYNDIILNMYFQSGFIVELVFNIILSVMFRKSGNMCVMYKKFCYKF